MNKKDFLRKEQDLWANIKEIKTQIVENENAYKQHLLELNGYKIGDVLTCEIGGKTEKGVVTGVTRVMGDNSFYLEFKKVKKNGTASMIDNFAMSHRYKLHEN